MTTQTTLSLSEQLLKQWNDLARKTAELGAEIPAADFDERPVDGVRSAAEIFRHLAFWNSWVAASARGENPDGAANELPRKTAPTKARALAAFEASVEEAASALTAATKKSRGELDADIASSYASFLGHTSEHYGQLVVYARLRGIVPPSSR